MQRQGHPLTTRWAHLGLAVAVVVQLLTSLGMEGPRRGEAGNGLFTVHEISGLAALVFAFCFWLAVAFRRRGTPVGLLFPWWSIHRVEAVWDDVKRHIAQLVRFRLPDYDEESPLASAVHGLGLLLMSAMALTGAVWFASSLLSLPDKSFVRLDMTIHSLLANLVWAYLIGHALLALLHHVTGNASLARMWSLRRT